MLTPRSQKAERSTSKPTWSWSVESEPQKSRNLLECDVRLHCRRNQTATVGLGGANCGGTQLKTRRTLAKEITKSAPPKAFTICRLGSLSVRERLTRVLGRRLRTLVFAFPRRLHDLSVIYLDAKQLLLYQIAGSTRSKATNFVV